MEIFIISAEGVSVNLWAWALAFFHPLGMLIVATDWEEYHHFFLWRQQIVQLGSAIFTSVACCQLDLSCFPIPLAFYVYILLFWVTVSCCLVPRILFAAGLVVDINWSFNMLFRDLISTLGSGAKPPPLNLYYFWGSVWFSWILGQVHPSWSQPSRGRNRGQVPGPVSYPGRQLPMEVVSDLVALFCVHLADASFLTPADSLWLLVPVEGNPVLQMLPLLCLWLCISWWAARLSLASRDHQLETLVCEGTFAFALQLRKVRFLKAQWLLWPWPN